jgi:CBS domain-containing protein
MNKNHSSKIVREVMSENVQILHPGAPIREACEKMKRLDVGAMPVCEDDRLVGMITDRDIVIRGFAEGLKPEDEIVSNAMSMPVLYCFDDVSVEEAATIMEEKQIRRLAVLNRQKRLIGIVSLGDLAVDAREENIAGQVLERVSENSKRIY